MEKQLELKNIPWEYELCFNENCPLREKCLHYQAYLLQPATKLGGPAIYPSAWKSGECSRFTEAKLIQKAWGFDHLYDNVPMPMLSKVCDKLRREREVEIHRKAVHNTQMRNELSCYEHSIENVGSMLKKNTGYTRSPQYQWLKNDIAHYMHNRSDERLREEAEAEAKAKASPQPVAPPDAPGSSDALDNSDIPASPKPTKPTE